MRERLFRIASTGVFSALAFVLTAFCEVPYAGGAGYLNFGDIVTLFVSMSLGPIEGAIVGIVGGSMGDLFLGYASYIPFTILAKALMGSISGLCFLALKKKKGIRFISPYIGAIFMVLTYMLAYYLIIGRGVYISSLFDCLQAFIAATASIFIYLPIEKSGVLSRYLKH